MNRRPSTAAALFAATFFLASTALAQRGGGAMNAPGSAALSPDGAQIAWTLRGREGTTLHVNSAPVNDPSTERLVAPDGTTNCSNTAPVWSPDSQTLAFTSTCTGKEEQPGQEQLFLWSRKSGEVRQLTHIKGNLQQAAWSPDGAAIAFLFVENATRSAGALDAMKPWAGVIGEDNVEVQGVYTVNVSSGKGGWLVPATSRMYTYEFAWSPNSREVAFIGAPTPGENNWWVAKLYVLRDLSGSPDLPIAAREKEEHVVLDPNAVSGALHGLQIAVPRWSPDGRRIAFIGGLMSDQGSTGGDVWVVDSKGGQPTDITPGIDGTPTWEAWLNGHTVGFVEDRRGHTLLTDADADKHMVVPNSSDDLGEVSISGGPIKNAVTASSTGVIAYVQSSATQPPEIWLGTPGQAKPYTHLNPNWQPKTRTESVEWTNEGFHVQGWLTYPINYDAKKKYPLIVTVHGGPSASSGPGGGGQWAQGGYFEFRPNPRGSFGQGEAFTAANRKDFGYGDLRDILAGLDMLEARFPIDRKREGLTGWSYGGFMSMFAATQTDRFAAIVAGAGISDWLSYYGENSIDQWMLPFFGASVYDDPGVYAKSSAISYIKKAKTPMLILVGDRDGECPAPQSFEMWHALRDQGVKTQLVVYPNEGHGFRDPTHIRDRQERTVRWFAENMPAK